jgi:hypothetical protein
MADITVQATAVIASASAKLAGATAGASITAGKVLYKDAATGTIKLADSNDTTATNVVGVALNDARANQPIDYITQGDLTLTGSSLTVGQVYVLSTNAGGIAPVTDLPNPTSAGVYVTVLGVAKSATVLALKPHNSGTLLGA